MSVLIAQCEITRGRANVEAWEVQVAFDLVFPGAGDVTPCDSEDGYDPEDAMWWCPIPVTDIARHDLDEVSFTRQGVTVTAYGPFDLEDGE